MVRPVSSQQNVEMSPLDQHQPIKNIHNSVITISEPSKFSKNHKLPFFKVDEATRERAYELFKEIQQQKGGSSQEILTPIKSQRPFSFSPTSHPVVENDQYGLALVTIPHEAREDWNVLVVNDVIQAANFTITAEQARLWLEITLQASGGTQEALEYRILQSGVDVYGADGLDQKKGQTVQYTYGGDAFKPE